MMAWFHFRQNNSGGVFDIDREVGIGPEVWIQAENADQANSKAETIGIYFNGCEQGLDCDCCGDRWYWVSDDDAREKPDLDQYRSEVYLHYANGSLARFGQE